MSQYHLHSSLETQQSHLQGHQDHALRSIWDKNLVTTEFYTRLKGLITV